MLFDHVSSAFLQVIIEKRIDGEMIEKATTIELADLGIKNVACTIVQRVIMEMKTITAEESEVKSQCPVCGYTYKTKELQTLSCLHQMCKGCLEEFKKKLDTQCPLCRTPLIELNT